MGISLDGVGKESLGGMEGGVSRERSVKKR